MRSLAEVLRRGPLGGAPAGAVLGPYEVLRELGRGGMGIVYEAARRPGDERVALKVLIAGARASDEQCARFLREARAAAEVRHPGVVAVVDSGVVDDLHFVAFEFVAGETLAEVFAKHPLPGRVVALVLDVADALGEVHARGFIHRDVKPGNVLVRASDGRALLADFGLVKDTLAESSLTAAGAMIGTPTYMASEQILGEKCTPATDVFALGTLLYEGLTGTDPFPSPNPAMRLDALARPPRAPSALAPAAGTAYDAVCRRALARKPTERFADASAFGDALRSAREKPPGRSAGVRFVVLAVTVGAILGVVAAVAFTRSPSPAPPPAAPATPLPSEPDSPPEPDPPPAPEPPPAPSSVPVPVVAPPQPTARPPLPLPEGLRTGEAAGEYVNDRDGSVLVWIPPGKFRMGWLRGGKGGKEVQFAHGYFIGKYEVRAAEWKRFLATGHKGEPAQKLVDGYPVGHVSWLEAAAYCAWARLRLPTEAEWEYAAHADTGHHHPWGDDPPGADRANVGPHDGPVGKLDGYASVSPSGAFPRGASPFGCLDMAGNLWEWVKDGPPYFARGGSYYLAAPASSAIERSPGYDPTRRRANYGFRVAR